MPTMNILDNHYQTKEKSMETLSQQLRRARLEENEIEINRIKGLMNIPTRNVTNEIIINKSGGILRVKQSFVISDKQEETREIYTVI